MNPPAPSNGVLLSTFERHYAELVRYLTRRTGDAAEARALAHDTWVRIAEQPENGVVPADPRAYLFTISHNVAMNHLRRGSWMQGYLAECMNIDTAAPTQAPDVADGAMYRQAVAVVDAALSGLSPRVRDTYLANGLHGEKQVDIALRLGVSVNTVERDIAQAARCIEDALHAWRHTPRDKGGAAVARTGRRRSLAALLGLAAIGLGSGTVWHRLQREALRYQATLSTLRGHMLQRRLPDGSDVTLDAESRLEIDFDAGQRMARLAGGAAFFAVQRDVERPFIVQARDVRVTVLGTRFGVEIDGGQGVVVQVELGRVRVEAYEKRYELTAGQSLRAFEGELVLSDVAKPAAWRQGELEFAAVPLADVLARLARYAPATMRATPEAARLRISGHVRVADARDWLDSLPSVLPVRLRKLPEGGMEVSRR